MKGTTGIPVALLLTLALQPAQASVVALTLAGAGTAAPATFPFAFGNQPLGEISSVIFTLCFQQPASPAGACDGTGSVGLQESLASPFFLAGSFRETVATGAKTPANFPVTLGPGQRAVVFNQWVANQLGPVTDSLVLRATPTAGTAENFTLNLSGSGISPGPCLPNSQALCLNSDRFKVQSDFLTSTADSGAASVVELTSETGYLYFFSASNVEAVVKVLNACSFNNRYWVFAGGLTDVRTVITVTDTQGNAVKTYINPQGTAFQPIQDTSAFATCP